MNIAAVPTNCSLDLWTDMYDRNLKQKRCLHTSSIIQFPLISPVNVRDGQIESLCLQLVLLADLHQPVHQDGPHGVRDVGLLAHVVVLGHVLHLRLSEIVVNVL